MELVLGGWAGGGGLSSMFVRQDESGGDTSTSQAEESAAQATAKAQAEAAQAANPWVLLEKLQKDAGLPSFKPLVLNLHDAAPIWASAGRWVLGRLSSALHRTYIETEFNDEEFLEGCQDAYYMVQQLFGAGDFEELKPMVASSVLKAFREVHEEYAAHKLKFSLQVEEVTGAALEDISWWPRQKMAERHDEVSTEAPLGAVGSAGDSGPDVGAGAAAATAPLPGQKVRAKSKYYDMWLVMGVRFTGRTKSTTVDETGKVLSETIDNRSHRWQFAKGPLPTYLPVITLDMPWVVVNVGL
ncbi:hypothetical protein WJX72_006065 [[Myrmecia] bisecta]|uniref:Tim44-like domain-containing protein n=1 Tax=[Myrmecia] bisecta TaxID=41462 RepID=A0AAW1QFC0_9CHLO